MPLSETLSPELWDEIIDLIAQDQYYPSSLQRQCTLAACARTCRTWLPRSRLHLYAAVTITTHDVQLFLDAVSSNPLNGAFVRELWLQPGWNDANDRDQSDEGLFLFAAQLPDKLPSVLHIILDQIDLSPVYLSFFTQLQRFLSVRTLSVEAVRFVSVRQLFDLVRAFPSLETLRRLPVPNNSIQGNDTHDTPAGVWPHDKLSVPHLVWANEEPDNDNHLWTLFDPAALVSLTADYHVGENSYDNLMFFLHHHRHTLRSLTLDTSISEVALASLAHWPSHFPHILYFEKLQYLEFRLHTAHRHDCLVPMTVSFLLTAELRALRYLTLSFIEVNVKVLGDVSVWAPLDTLLTQPPWDALDRFHIAVHGFQASVHPDRIRALLPLLTADPRVSFNSKPNVDPFGEHVHAFEYSRMNIDDLQHGRLLIPVLETT